MVFDIIAASQIYEIVCKYRGFSHQTGIKSIMLWLYNPITATVSSRGNAESIMAVLVLLSIKFLLKSKDNMKNLCLAGFFYALSVHFKIYPITYALPFYLIIHHKNNNKWKIFGYPLMPDSTRILFIFISAITFFSLTFIGYYS